ncbi:cytochrome P450 [Coprinopsis cinerea AmutBmut pab1-1]|nr:cytochrome P450 [Coprinopsis cinerea AmutBmut pab1-1]
MKEVMRSFRDGYPAEVFLDWMKEYGNTFQLRAPTDSRIITFEPDHIKAILATQFENFIKGDIFKAQMDSLLGVGVFNSDGEMWKFHRSMTRPFFTRERISDFETFDTHAEEALHLARTRLREGYPIDFQDLAARFTLDSASSFLFGNDVRSLEAGLAYPPSGTPASQPLHCSSPSSSASSFTSSSSSPINTQSHNQNHTFETHLSKNHTFETHPSNTFVHAFQSAQLRSAFRTRLGEQWALAEFWGDKVRKERGVVDGFVEAVLERGVREWEEEEEEERRKGEWRRKKEVGEKGDGEREGKEDVTLLQHLVRTTQDRKILKDELVNLLVAGRDTSATLLTFALYALTQHPHVESKLRNEVISKVGYSRRPDYEDMKELKYLRAFVNEVLRLYPPVPFDSRVSVNETIWESKTPEGEVRKHYIPASTRILYGVMYMQRRKDLWGPDAEEFDPDRFIDARLQKYLIPNPYIFCPFNAGPRICLGQQFAYHETSFFLIRLIQQFKNFRLAEDAMTEDTKPPETLERR